MKKRHVCAFAIGIALALPAPVSAQDALMLNTHGSTLQWQYLDRIAHGLNIPTTVQSITAREASFYGIDTGIAPTDQPTVKAEIRFQPFILGWSGLQSDSRMTDTSYLTRFHLDDPVIVLGASFASGSFYGNAQLDFSTDSLARYAGKNGVTGFWKPMDYISYWTFPAESYLAWSSGNLSLAAGRLPSGIGLGETNILLNGQARWYDQVQLAWWSEKFRFFAFWGTSSSHLSEAEYSVQSNFSQVSDSWGWDTINNHDASTQALVPFKMFTYHRFEFKPWSRVGFGLSEMQLIGGKMPDLTNLLPTVAWHNTYSAGVTNVMLHVDTWFVPVNGLLVFGEFLMDDSKAPSESGASKPSCWGWELGTTAVLPVTSRDWRFSATAEYNHADKWTYSRWQPYLTMYQRQLITGGSRGFDIPLGHPEGGDVDQASLRLTALARDGRKVELSYTFINKGPVYLGMIRPNPAYIDGGPEPEYLPVYYDYDELTGTAGSLDALLGHIRKYTHVINVKADWPLTANLTANAEIDYRIILNAGHVAGAKANETVCKTGLTWTYGNR